MHDRYRLVALGNEQLLAAVKGLVRRENVALSDMLAHLAELDERRLFLDLGYSSLFADCTEALGFCKSTAGRRIAAARVCRRYPDTFVSVAIGKLRLSVLSVLGAYLNADNADELFETCSGKSFEQVEDLLAARFPRPDVRDLIRRLPNAARVTPDVGSETPEAVSKHAESVVEVASTDPMAAKAATLRNIPSQSASEPSRARLEPLAPDRFGGHFTANTAFRELLEEVKALASHQEPRGELLPIMTRALESYRRELQKKRFAVGVKPRVAEPRSDVDSESGATNISAAPLNVKRTRRISAAVRRAVYERDERCCVFVSDEGRRCGARQFLEMDHVQPWALHGESTVDNLRLRCREHKQHSVRSRLGVRTCGRRSNVRGANSVKIWPRRQQTGRRVATTKVAGPALSSRTVTPKALTTCAPFCDHQVNESQSTTASSFREVRRCRRRCRGGGLGPVI